MNRNTKIPLGKKDSVLRDWWDNVSDDCISQPICLAIAYYAKTGKFLQIGTVQPLDTEYENTIRYVYIPNNSIAYNFLKERQEHGERIATLVKYILRNSIKEENKTTMYSVDELRVELEALSHKEEIKYVVKEEEKESTTSYSQEKAPPVMQSNKVDTVIDNDDDEDDLISALLGDIGFSF